MNKICFIVGEFPVVSQTFVVNQVVSAIKNKFNVAIYTYNKLTNKESSQSKLIEEYGLLESTKEFDFGIPKNMIFRFVKGIYFYFTNFGFLVKSGQAFKLRSVLTLPYKVIFFKTFKNYHVIHVNFGHYGLDVALMKKMGVLDSKLIVTFHGYDAHAISDVDKKRLIKQYRVLFEVSDIITVNTPYLKNIVESIGARPDSVRIIPMGIDVNIFKKQTPKVIDKTHEINLISVGRLIDFKGHKYAIKSVKKLVELGYNLRYVIIGDGKLKTELQNLITKLNLTEYVFLLGKKNQQEIIAHLNDSDIFLMCSITDSTGRCETQGVVTVEAQSSGLPVVAFDSGGVKYTFEENKSGFLVPEKDVDAYANAIKALIEDDNLYSEFSKNAIKFVEEHYNIDLTSQKFLEFYSS